MQRANLTDILIARKDQSLAGITFIEGSGQEEFLSYHALYYAALRALSFLQDRGVRPGDELVFQIEDNKSFIIVFWASVLGGIIPVPLSIGRTDEHKQKLFNVWPVLNNPYLITLPAHMEKIEVYVHEKGLEAEYAAIEKRIVDEAATLSAEREGNIYETKEDDITFIQFSSGSTGSPKGVVLTHRNLVANMEGISRGAGYSPADATLSWMPLTHDMGLIGFHLSPLFSNMSQYLMPTSLFIRTPGLWMDKASAHKVSILSSPNFGYKYFSRHCDLAEAYNWDLSTIRVIYNGAEPISEKICQEFLDNLEKYGLKRTAMCPVYGLAEASVAVSMSRMEDEIIPVSVDRRKLHVGDTIVELITADHAVSFVNVGKAIDHCLLRIADDDDKLVAEAIVGNIQIKGANVTGGYYNNEEETEKVLTADGWLNTGDLGFMKQGALYITGRAKDIIFINGQNYYPHDIERVAESVEGIELNKIAVAGFFHEGTQKEETVAFVFYRGSLEKFIPLAKAVQATVNRHVGIELDRILPVKDIPRTTSGKLQRFKLLEQYRSGVFKEEETALQQLMLQSGAGGTKPSNETEQRLLEIWERVLNTTAIDVHTHFSEAGGNSLKAAEMGMLLLKEFGVNLSFETLYAHQTIRELAGEIVTAAKQTYIPILVTPDRACYPVSSSQKRLYYHWQADPASIAYNIPVALTIKGEADAARLEGCIQQLLLRHDVLRTSFHIDGEPVFKIHDHIVFALDSVECGEAGLDTTLRSFVKPFTLDQAPLFRIKLLKVIPGMQVLFIDMHHIISDGLSLYHFIKELLLLYEGKDLPALPIGYKDHACHEKEQADTAKELSAEPYWLNRLESELPVLEMPTDHTRPVIFNTEGGKAGYTLDKEITGQLRKLAQENNCTLHVLLFTLYNVLLSKYTGQEDIITGIPVSGRPHPDLQYLLGMFVNNLAIRSSIRGEASLTELLAIVKHNMREALDNQDYPFERLVAQVTERRDVSRNPVFDTMFIYQNMGWPAVENAGISFSRYFFDPGFSKFDISLEVFEEEDTISYAIEFATKLFRKDTIVGLSKHFEHLIQEVLAHPGNKVSDLSLLTNDEYDEYVNGFNDTTSSYPADKTIYQLFEDQVSKQPLHTAIDYNGQIITYEQLDRQANKLAIVLREKGIGPDVVAGILLQRSPELVVAILAVLKAGGCYLPIDTDLPDERIRYIVTDSRCRVVITDSVHGMRVAEALTADSPFFVVYTDKPLPGAGNNALTGPVNKPGDLAYIIYTSGTTGQPKGVMIGHASLVNYISWAAKVYSANELASFPLFTSISFDLTVTSVFTPLITGGSIVIYEEDGRTSLMERIIQENKVTIIKLTPSHLKILADSKCLSAGTDSKIKALIVGGEQLETRLAQAIYDRMGGKVNIYNEYGPTETTVGCMIHRFEPGDALATVPIGVPAANTRIYLLDKFLQPVPAGVQGELYIGGDGVARGYLFREELTRQQFIPDPFVGEQRMYKTGDIGRRLPSGMIAFTGRADHQVKINGYRIELAEIENHLLDYTGITGVLVVVRTNQQEQKKLYAYYKSEEFIEVATLKNYLAGRLPYYMIPLHFIRIGSIPLTKNGKVDHQALPDPETDLSGSILALPKNKMEELFVKVWTVVLGATDVRITDNFFELGGDSIKAVQVTSKLRNEGVVLQVKDILIYHTIEQISLHASFATDAVNKYEQGIAAGNQELLPVDAWFFSFDHDRPGYYNQSILLRLRRAVNVGLLEQAFKILIGHHDGLRLNYDAKKQVLYYNNSHLEKYFFLEERVAGEGYSFTGLKGSFDITKSLLIKAALIHEPGASDLLFITAHHLVIDGVSWRILLEDLYTVYQSLEKGEAVKLPEKTATMIDWSRRLADYAASGKAALEKAYWEEIVNTVFVIPYDMETTDWKAVNLHQVRAVLDANKTDFLLKKANQSYKTDVQILLLTALGLTLKAWTGSDTVLIELENHGRHLEGIDVSRTTGWFTVMHPLKLELHAGPIGQQLQSIKQQIRSVPGQGIGYGIYKYGESVRRNEKPAVRFNYLGQFGQELHNDFFSYDHSPHGSETDPANEITAWLELNAMIINGELLLAINYNRKVHQESTITWFRDTFFNKLDLILEHLQREQEVHFVPSDFDTVQLDEGDLKMLFE